MDGISVLVGWCRERWTHCKRKNEQEVEAWLKKNPLSTGSNTEE